ncbi:MAG: diaminopimelate epimerase [Candidatus Omnitrophica bacterium]|nr:diaminopimelate epimerase [Candidatus Omnitrophota bacterium]
MMKATHTPIETSRSLKKPQLVCGFKKMVAAGNDFVVVKSLGLSTEKYSKLAKKACDRKFGIGADGLLVMENSKIADIRMRIFNADGSEAEMCGNGARCAAYWTGKKIVKIETKAGIINSEVKDKEVKIQLTDPFGIRLDIPIKVNNRLLKVNFVNTGVPHVVIFAEGLDKIKITDIAPYIRYHKEFAPKGTNVNFIEPIDKNSFKIRTYERGVEDETLACGTGSVASSVIFSLKTDSGNKVNVHTKSGEILKVYFERTRVHFTNVWLEGEAKIVYEGDYYV